MRKPAILMIAGFGDDASMYAPLLATPLAEAYELIPMDLPGFGAPALDGTTSLDALAEVVANRAAEEKATVIVAHSVASIIASLAAGKAACPITTIVSLEGNITAEDAYFSGTAADFETLESFRRAFLNRLITMAETDPIIARYRERVERANMCALWQLGCDARRFSEARVPGDVLRESAEIVYFYNPSNCPASTVAWLEQADFKRVQLPGASHWPSIDQPIVLAAKIVDSLI